MSTEPDVAGRVIITWPASAAGAVPGWGLTVLDADTGEQLVDATALTITHGDPGNWDSGPIHATLTRLVDDGGQPIGMGPATGAKLVPTDEYAAWRAALEQGDPAVFVGQMFRTADFRYLVAEMRTAPFDPTVPTRESVNRGEHSIDQYRHHHGITEPYPSSVYVDFAEYGLDISLGGTIVIRHAVDNCDWQEPVVDDTLSALAATAIQHYAEHHTMPGGISIDPADVTPEQIAEWQRYWDETMGRPYVHEIATSPTLEEVAESIRKVDAYYADRDKSES